MNNKEFILPGVALGAILIIGGLVAWQGSGRSAVMAPSVASSTVATSTQATSTAVIRPNGSVPYSGPTYGYGSVTVALGQVAGFQNGISMRPLAVVEDSRCPINARCIQAGTVKLQVRINTLRAGSAVDSEEYVFERNVPRTVQGSTITLTDVQPAPVAGAGSEFSSNDYRFTFTVTAPSAATTPSKPSPSPTKQCFVGGCSSHLCTDNPAVVSSCEYRSEYACYKTATCERQRSGQCGWTQTASLTSCLANPPSMI